MELIGYDITLEPTGLHKITLDCIGCENDLETIRKVYYNPGLYQVIGFRSSAGTNNKKENKTMSAETRTFTATEFCRIEREAYDKGYKRGREVGRSEGFVDGRKTSAESIKNFSDIRLRIKKVIFNDPATIVFWADGTKTVAKAHGDDKFDKEVGLTVCIAKKALGNRSNFDKVFKKWIK